MERFGSNQTSDTGGPSFSDRKAQPAIFVPIGSPPFLIEESEARNFMRELGSKCKGPGRRPLCVVCISARWVSEDNRILIMSNPLPKTAHDFFGFAEMYYDIDYPAEGSVKAAARVAEALSGARLDWEFDETRGFDFGCWGPMLLLFPDADIPVIQVSLHSSLDPHIHIAIGEALAPLRSEGYLLLCSGGVTHNPLEISFTDRAPSLWAATVDHWVSQVLHPSEGGGVAPEDAARRRNQRLATMDGSDSLRNNMARAHPVGTYLLPLMVAAGSGGPCAELHRSWMYGDMSMAAYMFASSAEAADRWVAGAQSPGLKAAHGPGRNAKGHGASALGAPTEVEFELDSE